MTASAAPTASDHPCSPRAAHDAMPILEKIPLTAYTCCDTAEASGKATKKLQLSSAASRLAALRGQSPQEDQQKEETQSLEAVVN